MNFKYSEQQDMLRTMAREFLAGECPKSRTRELEQDARGYDPGTWKRMAELGWQGLLLPTEYDGSGADFIDLVVLMEEMGRNILPGPFYSTVALAALPIMDYGSREQQARYLPGISGGETVWTLAVDEDPADCDYSQIRASARLQDGAYLLNGEKTLVPCAGVSDYMLVAARISKNTVLEKGLTLFIVDMKKPGIEVETIPTITGETLYQVRFNNVKLDSVDVLGAAGTAENMLGRILDKAALLKCADVCGACQAVLEMSIAYAGERKQFGKPIGTFQVIQHRLVDMLIQVEGLQHLVYQAGWMMSTGADCSAQIAMAKVKASEVYQQTALDGIRVHGAIGFSLDHDAGLYYRRVLASKFFPHDAGYYLEKVAVGIGL
ncbi:MAG: acyl-CoA/acyl-ACP dehydrogenase [Dehalococcoidia bacterium]|nr:acyl-CoA/acyl-ACP dehydrogenase [Dehalococcoidia bacterium]